MFLPRCPTDLFNSGGGGGGGGGLLVGAGTMCSEVETEQEVHASERYRSLLLCSRVSFVWRTCSSPPAGRAYITPVDG